MLPPFSHIAPHRAFITTDPAQPAASFPLTAEQRAALDQMLPGWETAPPAARRAAAAWRDHPWQAAAFGSLHDYARVVGLGAAAVRTALHMLPGRVTPDAEQRAAMDLALPGWETDTPDTRRAAEAWCDHHWLAAAFGSLSDYARALGLSPAAVKSALQRHPGRAAVDAVVARPGPSRRETPYGDPRLLAADRDAGRRTGAMMPPAVPRVASEVLNPSAKDIGERRRELEMELAAVTGTLAAVDAEIASLRQMEAGGEEVRPAQDSADAPSPKRTRRR